MGADLLPPAVETDDDRPAVVLTLREEGTEWKHKGTWQYVWKERSRHLEVRPFTLRLPGGEAVRVEPDEQVALIDALHLRDITDRERERRAEIVAGERICLDGVLQRSRRDQGRGVYRSRGDTGDTPIVLRRPLAEPLLMASGGLAAARRRWAAWYGKAALALAAAFAVLHLGFYLEYHALRFAGEIVPRARVINQWTATSRHNNRTREHHMISAHVDLPGGATVEVQEELALGIRSDREPRLREVPIQIVPRMPWVHQAGTEPRISQFLATIASFVCLAALAMFWVLRRNATPWYEQRRVVERGAGTLLMSVHRQKAESETTIRREMP